jgi:hypothetical protein
MVVHRHFAGAEALDADLVLDLFQARHEAAVQFGRRHDDPQLALQSLIKRFSHLH